MSRCRCHLLTGAAVALGKLGITSEPTARDPVQSHPPAVVAAGAARNELAMVSASPDLLALRRVGAGRTDAIVSVITQQRLSDCGPRRPCRPDGQVEYRPERDARLAADVSRVRGLSGWGAQISSLTCFSARHSGQGQRPPRNIHRRVIGAARCRCPHRGATRSLAR